MQSPPNPVLDTESQRRVRGTFTDLTVTVYQAYSPPIADAGLAAGTFVSPFKRDRMTWIKPSFLWIMYRSGWATKPSQERILAIEITRVGFEWALAHAALSHHDSHVYQSPDQWRQRVQTSPVRIQWDPDRSITLQALDQRAIQIGLSNEAVDRYVETWIQDINDVTDLATEIHHHSDVGDLDAPRANTGRAHLPAPGLDPPGHRRQHSDNSVTAVLEPPGRWPGNHRGISRRTRSADDRILSRSSEAAASSITCHAAGVPTASSVSNALNARSLNSSKSGFHNSARRTDATQPGSLRSCRLSSISAGCVCGSRVSRAAVRIGT
ncbi:DUF4291 family protein [Amycolatopsis sp. RM579]|uniref:DUF4291 family protein n=1 Tax=Amycolatopsis pithecellobii TaxID=664692 RepID=A0A6N7Z8T9_9PSEU|nr:DUF4291 family protein [Amycolatopsis pithecellobii]